MIHQPNKDRTTKPPLDSQNNDKKLLCEFFMFFRDNGEKYIGMTIEQFVDVFLIEKHK